MRHAIRPQPRRGWTLVELLTGVSVMAILIAILTPAVQSIRESGRRSQCINNMRQIGCAVLSHESAFQLLPSGGEGTIYTKTANATVFNIQGTLWQILPYMDQDVASKKMDPNFAYNDARHPGNQASAKIVVASYLCPSNSQRPRDPDGYGQSDYMATVYTDIDPNTGVRNTTNLKVRMDGMLALGLKPPAFVRDGMSNTIMMVEDAGRVFETVAPHTTSRYRDPVYGTAPAAGTEGAIYNGRTGRFIAYTGGVVPPGETPTPSKNRAINRWAEPDQGNGVSGPPNSSPDLIQPVINNNAWPIGGPQGPGLPGDVITPGDLKCGWATNNCGPNDEPFGWHSDGCHAVFGDNSVRLLSQRLDSRVMRCLVTRAEGKGFSFDEVK